MTAKAKRDQRYAEAQDALDTIVEEVQAALAVKRERHGEKFDNATALYDLFPRFHKMSPLAKTILLSTALFRLAQTEDPFAEIADLDFEFDPEEN
jgi:hypothetical protein